MKNLLGGKGANLAEMSNLGLPVSPGFTITTEAAYGKGVRDSRRLVEITRAHITEVDQLQYLKLRDAQTLEVVQGVVGRPAALCVAPTVGPTRLIDNVLLSPPPTALADHELELVSQAIGRSATAGRQGLRPS